MEFINRQSEIDRIKKLKEADESRLLILYGRRRTGKTRLLQHVKAENDIFYTAGQNEKSLQLKSLANLIGQHVEGFNRVNYPDWESMLVTLNERLDKKITLIIDEFPYLVKNAPELPGVIQKLFDHRDRLSFHLMLCGSSQQMMHNLVIDSSAPLYGRANEIIKLLPLDISAMMQAFKCTPNQAIEEYSVGGGVYQDTGNYESNKRISKKRLFIISSIATEFSMKNLSDYFLMTAGILYRCPA
jgi:hypothetical protein